MSNSSNENIKEIFLEMIKEVDENSLENYVEFLKKSIRENNANKFKENKFAITKLVELKNFKEQQLAKIEKHLVEKSTQLSLMESKIKTAEKDYNALLEKIKQKDNEYNNKLKEMEIKHQSTTRNLMHNQSGYPTLSKEEHYISIMNEAGQGIPQDYKTAFELCEKSANNKNIKNILDTIFEMGLSYFYGRGVIKNIDIAIRHFTAAANKNHLSSLNKLGDFYINRDYKKAFDYYKKAAEQGNEYAISALRRLI